jgi:dolichol-phosphate mannosyltransferase
MLSIIIPVKDEENSIQNVVDQFKINPPCSSYEVLFVNDFSKDNTLKLIKDISSKNNLIKVLNNENIGLGSAISLGIKKSTGDYCCIMMSDLSDSLEDLKKYHDIIKNEDIDSVFGSRFLKGSIVKNYPLRKLILNRIFNLFTKIIFLSDYNDFTNAFKIYKRKTLLELMPFVSEDFNVFLEIPLKIISRKYEYRITSISWINRKYGKSKFEIKELRSKYLFTLFYCFFEKILIKKKK